MKVKEMYSATNLPYHYVVETMDGRMMMFQATPARRITGEDLLPLEHYAATGNQSEPAPDYIRMMYGITKE